MIKNGFGKSEQSIKTCLPKSNLTVMILVMTVMILMMTVMIVMTNNTKPLFLKKKIIDTYIKIQRVKELLILYFRLQIGAKDFV